MKRAEWHMGDDSWAEVEIYRLAHGILPPQDGSGPKWNAKNDTAKALGVLADEIMSDEPPNRLNAAEVCLYASKLLGQS